MGVMALASVISGNGPAPAGVFLVLAGAVGFAFKALAGLFLVAIRVKLEVRQKWR
jgi:hypothetical protein